MNVTKAFTVDNGISFNDFVAIFEGIESPEIICLNNNIPNGSLYIKYSGIGDIDFYQKISSNEYNKLSNIFGSQYKYESSENESSTTSTTFQTKVILNIDIIKLGNYRIGWSYDWAYDNTGKDFKGRVLVDSNPVHIFQTRPISNVVSSQDYISSGFWVGELNIGNHNILLQYCSNTYGKTAYIRNARLEVWRVN